MKQRQSTFKSILISPALYKYKLENPIEQTNIMKLGSALHLLILQPEEAVTLVRQKPTLKSGSRLETICNLLNSKEKELKVVTKKTKTQGDDFYEVHEAELAEAVSIFNSYSDYFTNINPDIYWFNDADYQLLFKLLEAYKKNQDAVSILQSCTAFEKKVSWNEGDIEFEGTIDAHSDQHIVELKLTSKRPNDFYDIVRYVKTGAGDGYGFQLASYKKAVPSANKFYIIFISLDPPHEVYPVQIPDDVMAACELQYKKALDIYRRAKLTDFQVENRLRWLEKPVKE